MTVSFQDTDLATPPKTLVVGSDTIGGIDYQRVKLAWGTTGSAVDASTSAGFPVQITAYSSAITTIPSSQITASVAPTTQWTVTNTPSSQMTVSVTPSSQFTVTTTPSTTLSVAQSTVPWSVLIATSTGASPQVIGSVAPSSQWTVTTTPSSQATVSVTPTTQFTVTSVPSSQATVTTSPSSTVTVDNSSSSRTLGYVILSSSTSTSITVPPIIGSVAPTTQWTVSTTPTSQMTVSVTPTTQFTVTTVPSSQITASVTPTTQFTVTTVPSSQITASVTPTSAFSININTSTGTIGTVLSTQILPNAADIGTIFSSGVAQTPLFHTVGAAATGLTALSSVVASKVQIVTAISVTNGSATVPFQFSLRGATSSTTLMALTAIAANGSIVLPYNPTGWVTTTTSEALNINVACTGTPAVGGCMTFVAI